MNNIPDMSQCCGEKLELVEAVLTELTSFERSCLLLRINDDFTEGEIAEILNKSQKTVQVALQRGYEQFRRIHLKFHVKITVGGEVHEKRPPAQQKEDEFVEVCIKTLPGPEQSIELPKYVREQWEAQDCIDSVQDTMTSTFPMVPSGVSTHSRDESFPPAERQSVQAQCIMTSVKAGTEDEDYLQQMDSYIRELVKSKVQKYPISAEIADLEIDELVQLVRIKLWQTLQKKTISNLKAHIRCIVNNALTSFMRQKRKQLQYIKTVDREIWEESLFLYSCEGTSDPIMEIEQKETEGELLKQIVDIALSLPFLQRTAFLCFLHERVDDPSVLNKALQKTESASMSSCRWPEDRETKRKLLISCNMARFRVAQSLGIDLDCYKTRR